MVRHNSLAALLIGAILSSPATGQNFVAPDPDLVQAAEAARVRSAVFWSGSALPGNWSQPCPIRIHGGGGSGAGRTDFRIDRGQVFGWKMTVSGSRDVLLGDVIPHEVDHMVRASLVRRPVLRWLDEGCASLMESAATHAQLRSWVLQNSISPPSTNWLQQDQYPATSAEVAALYANGFSLVEYLLSRDSPSRLLRFQKSDEPIESRLQQHYGLSVEALQNGWAAWRSVRRGCTCAECECPVHAPQQARSSAEVISKPVLQIWSASWCQPCQQFKSDLASDSEFRAALSTQFALQPWDFDDQAQQARTAGVTEVPTFIWPGGRLSGYGGKADLLKRLGLSALPERNSPTPPTKAPDSAPAMNLPAPATPMSSPSPSGRILPRPQGSSGWFGSGQILSTVVPATLSILQWAGVIGGTALTGGIGGVALAGVALLLQRRRQRIVSQNPVATTTSEGSAADSPAPFPRQLDEARQLLGLRQTEGRVPLLDALRGLFLDDELDKLAQSDDAIAGKFVTQLRQAIDARVDEVAPLTTSVES